MLFFPITQLPLVQLELKNATQLLHQHCFFVTVQANSVAFSQHLDQVCHGVSVVTLKVLWMALEPCLSPCLQLGVSWTICSNDTSSWPRWLSQFQIITIKNPHPKSVHLQDTGTSSYRHLIVRSRQLRQKSCCLEDLRKMSFEPWNYVDKVTMKSFKIASQENLMVKYLPLTVDLLLTLLAF